jgi:SlyX protein
MEDLSLLLLSNSGMQSPHDAERRLNELEIKASFTEDLLDQLNLTLYRQQQQIDSLILQVTQLRQQSPDPGAGATRNPRDELPPHY